MILRYLRPGMGAKVSLWLANLKRVVLRDARPDGPDWTAWRRGTLEALQRDDWRGVALDPLHAIPPHGRIIDLTGMLTITFDNKFYRLVNSETGAAMSYTVPDGHAAIVKHWGFAAVYDASDWYVDGPSLHIKASLSRGGTPSGATELTDPYRPYVSKFRPGQADSICRNAHLALRPGDTVTPMIQALSAGANYGTVYVRFRLWGWQWECGDPGQL